MREHATEESAVSTFAAYMVTCDERSAVRGETLARFERTDWGSLPSLQIDDGTARTRSARMRATWLGVLRRVAEGSAGFALVMEDDLDFNRHLRHNLTAWTPLRGRDGEAPFFGSIYNADRPALERPSDQSYFVADPDLAWGGQAVIVSRSMAHHFVAHWGEENRRFADRTVGLLSAILNGTQ